MISQGPICIKLKSIFPNGGLIGKIKVIIARVYPMLYHEKTSTGESSEISMIMTYDIYYFKFFQTFYIIIFYYFLFFYILFYYIIVFRNIRCEEKANIIYEKKCRSMIETFYDKAEKYFYTKKNKNDLNTDSIDLAAIEWNENCDGLSKKVNQIKNIIFKL